MYFRELEYIVSIAKNQGVGKAAKECNVSQPTLSKFVQNLENSLEQPLFRHLGNKFLLTYAGERYVDTAKIILEKKRELEKELSDIARKDVGEIKIAFRLCGGINIIPQVLFLFWKQYPRVKIKIHENNSRVLEDEIIKGDIDLAFITLPFKHPDIMTETISQEELVLVMPRAHPLAKEAVEKEGCKYPWMDITKLKDESFILPWQNQRTRQMEDRIFWEAGIKPNIILTVRNVNIMLQLVTKGFGMAFMGESTLRYDTEGEKLACFSVGNPKTEFNLAIAFRPEMYQPTYVKQFINIAKDIFSAMNDIKIGSR